VNTLVVVLILLHGPGGHEIRINPEQVTSLRAAKPGEDNKFLTEGAHCMVSLTDGKFVSVVEPCEAVQQMLETAK
jgi:hypothetical protein